ncbi:hypothetical protein IVG45_17295 [Methylomonas sp. LL1]|uniref:hypothetical protein n=1 Tax=Methylomonas sp. LL1 TaxID=2785785 RepID=UPI0018C38F26|nr:hypothetical protein [Methylomonas sp. LL1]QPK62588.1 hypothetical protein IVG45_17295 [Methylomonas sp. LL1]
MEEQQLKRRFRTWSFFIAWALSIVFFLAVLCFSYRFFAHPNCYWIARTVKSSQAADQKPPVPAEIHKTVDGEGQMVKEAVPQTAYPLNQFLILLGLLSAIGTTLAVSVMRFSFANDKTSEKDNGAIPISPIASSLTELLNAIIALVKKEK